MTRKVRRLPLNRLKNQAVVFSAIASSTIAIIAGKNTHMGLGAFIALFAALWLGIFVVCFAFLIRSEISKRGLK